MKKQVAVPAVVVFSLMIAVSAVAAPQRHDGVEPSRPTIAKIIKVIRSWIRPSEDLTTPKP